MDDKTIYQRYDELLEANTRLSAMVSMKFTAEQQKYLESNIEMDGLRITCVDDDIFGNVLGNIHGNVYGGVRGNVWGTVKGKEG